MAKEFSEEKVAATSYVLQFYKDVVALTHHHANYENVLLETKVKHKNIEKAVLTDEEKKALLDHAANVRHYIHKTYVHYQTIWKAINKQKEFPEKITKSYEIVSQQFILKSKDVVDYVMKMNFALEERVFSDLLKSSTEFINQVYGTEQTQDTK